MSGRLMNVAEDIPSSITKKIPAPRYKTPKSIGCSCYGCTARFEHDVKHHRTLLRDYAAAGWSYHYTPRGIRSVCPTHRILVD